MSQVDFYYSGEKISIQCNENDTMKSIFYKIGQKLSIDINSLYFIYSGKIINSDLTFSQLANSEDKLRKCMSILVYEFDSFDTKIPPNPPICSECGENVKIEFIDYKLKLFPCKNGHNENIILLNDYDKYQNIYKNNLKLTCDACKNKIEDIDNKNNITFYYCEKCKNNLCLSCSKQHDTDDSHNLITKEIKENKNKNYVCNEHDKNYNSYCKTCNKDICELCEKGYHQNHEKIFFEKILINIDDKKKEIIKLRNSLDELKKEIKEIIQKLNKVMDNFEVYYKINFDFISNYNQKLLNYEILNNLKGITQENIIKDINSIINELEINNKFIIIMKINNSMEKYTSFKYLINLRANETAFQKTFWNYWGNWGYFHSSGRVNNYDSDWEKGYPLLIQNQEKIIEFIGKIISDRNKVKYKSEVENFLENISLPVAGHSIVFNTQNEHIVRNSTTKFLNDINTYQLGYYKKLREYALKLVLLKPDEEIPNFDDIEDFENKMPKNLINLYHDGHGGNIPLSFPLISDKPGLFVKRQKTNESDNKVNDLLPFGQGVIVVNH